MKPKTPLLRYPDTARLWLNWKREHRAQAHHKDGLSSNATPRVAQLAASLRPHIASCAIGIQSSLQPERRGAQDPQCHGLAARSCEFVVRRRLHDFAAVAVGDD